MDREISEKRLYHLFLYACDDLESVSVEDYSCPDSVLSNLWSGKPVGKLPLGVRCSMRGTKPADFLANPIGWMLVSPRTLDLMGPFLAPDTAEILEIRLDGSQPGPHYIINPLLIRDCLDLEASDISYDPDGSVRGIGTYVLRSSSIGPSDSIFRLAQFPDVIFLSDILARTISKKKLTGIAFLRCSAR